MSDYRIESISTMHTSTTVGSISIGVPTMWSASFQPVSDSEQHRKKRSPKKGKKAKSQRA